MKSLHFCCCCCFYMDFKTNRNTGGGKLLLGYKMLRCCQNLVFLGIWHKVPKCTHTRLNIWTQIEDSICDLNNSLISPLMTMSMYCLKVSDKAGKTSVFKPPWLSKSCHWKLNGPHNCMYDQDSCPPLSITLFSHNISGLKSANFFLLLFSLFLHLTKCFMSFFFPVDWKTLHCHLNWKALLRWRSHYTCHIRGLR